MKIIGFAGSPHKEGNTAWAVSQVLEGAADQGAETRAWCFSGLTIQLCRGCLACHHGNQGCVIRDDMQPIYDALGQADALVFGTPVYMGQMSAQAKIFMGGSDWLFKKLV